jgi:hypothetical protein
MVAVVIKAFVMVAVVEDMLATLGALVHAILDPVELNRLLLLPMLPVPSYSPAPR